MKIFVLLLALAFGLAAQDATKPGRPWSYGFVAMPSSDTQITSLSIFVDYLYLNNTSGSAVTVTVHDKSTNCNGGNCYIANVSLAGGQIYAIPVFGAPQNLGIYWSATVANVVDAYIAGRY